MLEDNWDCRSSHAKDVYGFLLQGLVRCAACNRAMSPHIGYNRSGTRYLYYRCGRAIREGAGACPIRSVSARALEELLIERLRVLVDNEDVLARMVERYRETAEQRLPELTAQRDRLGGEMRRLRADAARLVDAVAAGGANGSRLVADRLQEVEAQIEVGTRHLADVNRDIERETSRNVTPQQMRDALRSFLEVWAHLEKPERKQLVRLLVGEVVYDGRSREIVWRLRPVTTGAAKDSSTLGFAEWKEWLPDVDSNHGHGD
ncbi:MAG: recombinase zinc beta ribbon domain-containing protein [Myxococcales bacterium]|nr:recombinase zinc beta ribbon domain-containing protein [Myxococcales bacterium]